MSTNGKISLIILLAIGAIAAGLCVGISVVQGIVPMPTPITPYLHTPTPTVISTVERILDDTEGWRVFGLALVTTLAVILIWKTRNMK